MDKKQVITEVCAMWSGALLIYDCVLLMIAQIFRYVNFCLGDVRIGECGNQFINLLNGAVPPLQTLEQVDHIIVESAAYDSCRIVDGYRKRRNVGGYRGICADYGSVAYMYAGHYRHILSDPYIVADNSVAFERQFIHYRSDRSAPVASHYVERIGRGVVHPMVGTVHDKGTPLAIAQKFPITNLSPMNS